MNAIGTAVTGGMLSATFIDLFYIPLLFVLVSRIFRERKKQQHTRAISIINPK
jgi:Cu/Ag efflux pump CusA